MYCRTKPPKLRKNDNGLKMQYLIRYATEKMVDEKHKIPTTNDKVPGRARQNT
ncbi:hypothetical protein [Methanobrevibacter sp.]|uniref:hypothetical protein n=1 Tax=Methanobrevibacter sp. TaxID=66852 RepID=UPI0025E9C962|nr:hypothetical protein [Methanobrevibacter sp.]MBQ2831562.1 hypothetical protein [Methanobrevibacter sp.]